MPTRATIIGALSLVLVTGTCAACADTDGGNRQSPDGNTPASGGSGGNASAGGRTSASGGSADNSGGSSAGSGGQSGTGGAGGRMGTGGVNTGGVNTGGNVDAGGGRNGTGGAGTGGPRSRPCASLQEPPFPSPLPADREATPASRGFGFVEGPVWISDRSTLLFSDMSFAGGNALGPPAQIRSLLVSPAGDAFGVLVQSSGSNGLALANDGRVLAATHDVQSLSYFEPATGARTDWPLLVGGLHFNSPNDLVVRSDGNVYFTDPNWQLGRRPSETNVEGFYRVSPAGDVSRIPISPTKPNGVTLSPDERTLYVGGQSGGIFALPLDASGAPRTPVPFSDGSTDGMTVDCAGNVYVTSDDVVVFDPSGNEIGRITLDRSPSNVAFGGDDARTLFITGGDTLFRIQLNVPGMPY